MNVFFDIPEVHQVALLTEWLEFRDFRRFYFAVWNRQRRAELKSLLSCAQCVFNRDDILDATEDDESDEGENNDALSSSVEWCISNGVRFKNITFEIPSSGSGEARRRLLRHLSTSLKTIMVYLNSSEPCSSENHQNLVAVLKDVSQICHQSIHVEFSQVSCSQPSFPEQRFAAIGEFLGNLAALNIASFFGFSNVPGSFLLDLSAIPSLRTVSFNAQCSFSKTTVSSAYSAQRNNVQSLHVSKCIGVCALFPNVIYLELNDLDANDLVSLVSHCPLVHTAVLSMSKTSKPLTANFIQAVGCWRSISKLALRNSTIAEELVTDLISSCTILTQLSTTDHTEFESSPSTNFPQAYAAPRLQKLQTLCCNADSLTRILASCPFLETLWLHSNNQTYNQSQVAPMLHAVQSVRADCSSLRHLKLIGYAALADENILHLQHTRLESLTISGSEKLKNNGLLAFLSTLHFLQSFQLAECHEIGHCVLLQIPKVCPKLRALVYTNCARCTCDEYGCGCGWYDRCNFIAQALRTAFPQLVSVRIDIG